MGRKMTSMWYEEEKFYNYTTNSVKASNPFAMIDHFIQLVWNGTTTLGCGLAIDNTGLKFIGVSRYLPQGNILGQNSRNIFPPTGKPILFPWDAPPIIPPQQIGIFRLFYLKDIHLRQNPKFRKMTNFN